MKDVNLFSWNLTPEMLFTELFVIILLMTLVAIVAPAGTVASASPVSMVLFVIHEEPQTLSLLFSSFV